MASSSQTASAPEWAELLPDVHLDVRQGGTRSATYALGDVDFLIGGVPGCDLRIGTDTPGVTCLLARHPAGVTLRKLAPTQSISVNGQNVAHAELADGDRVKIGTLEFTVHLTPARAAVAVSPDIEKTKHALRDQLEQFREKMIVFQAEKDAFERQRQELSQSSQAGEISWHTQRAEMQRELRERERLLEERTLEITYQKNELAKVRQEMADVRKQLYDHYQDRRDQLAVMHEDLEKARLALDEREKKLRLLEEDATDRRLRDRKRLEEIEQHGGELTGRLLRLEDERKKIEDDEKRRQSEWTHRYADLEQREKAIADQTQALDSKIKRYEADVLRLTRIETNLEQREADLQTKSDEMTRRRDALEQDTAELQQQLVQVDEWRVKMTDEAARLAEQKKTQDEVERQLAERGATLEGQQSTFTVLRSRLERMREDLRSREQQLDEQRSRQETREAEQTLFQQELDKLHAALESDQNQYERDRQEWLERGAVMDAAVRQMKQTQENLAAETERIRREREQLDERCRQFEESDSVLKGRLTQLVEAQDRLDAERQSLRERGVHLVQREEACAALQEQLHRRTEEIAGLQKDLAARVQEHQTRFTEFDQRRADIEKREQELNQNVAAWRADLEQKAAALEKRHAEVTGFEERHQDLMNQLAVQRKAQAEERAQFHLEQQAALARLANARNELDTLRSDTLDMVQQLPDAEVRAGAAVEQLADARVQLRNHLSEIHAYVRQCQDEMEQLRGRLQGDLDKLIDQEQTLRRNQDEHRLAMAAFRQQMIDWQGQITDLKRLLARDETRLERKQARAEERAKEIDVQSQKLAQHAEVVQQQEQEVAERRDEVDRHLVDMRQWYRHKLRELAGIPLMPDVVRSDVSPPVAPANDEAGEDGIVPIGRSILSITTGADPSDQKLGETLRDSQLIDVDTLTALLAEARRQRRSLRQVLLASGVVTLYQLALIEAGDVQGLMLGPVRVLDRLRHTTHETIFRVFDPRRGTEAVLRHLAEADMTDAVKPDEFRQRFAQAMLNDVHLANTLEVLDLSGRPAALQEWLSGLPATDWPPLAAAPGVCYRLLTQAAQGLATAHHAGVLHGHLSDAMMMLTADGVLKIRGLGEPPWLIGIQHDEEPSVKGDLRALGKIVSGWCTAPSVRKGAKTKPLPEALVSILYRLAADGDAGYRDAKELLADLENAASAIPPNAEAWDRLLKYVREHGAAEAMLRQSA